jgi:ribosome-associated protein
MTETEAKKKTVKKETPQEALAKLCEEIAYDRKAENIIRLDLKEYSAVSDYFVLCTATSEPHIRAIAERIQRDVLEKRGIKPLHVDGSPESRWMIVDFGAVMVHVMDEDTRALYQLESLWGDAPKTDAVKRITAKAKRAAGKKGKDA